MPQLRKYLADRRSTVAAAAAVMLHFSGACAATKVVVYSFQGGVDGFEAAGPLINVSGVLFGVTNRGGTSDYGTVLSINPATGTKRTLYSFQGGLDGKDPNGPLTNVNGTLYGTNGLGGAGTEFVPWGAGTVFSINPATGAEKVLYAFRGGSDGAGPNSGLTSVNGMLYGTTAYGGGTPPTSTGYGTVFSINPVTGAEKVLYAFKGGVDGQYPLGGLTNVNGTLYGATQEGGAHGFGTVYAIDPASGAVRVVYSFHGDANGLLGGTDGQYPSGGLTNLNGTLYGTTGSGGPHNKGTVFSVDPATGAEAVLHAFVNNRRDGVFPEGTMIVVKGILFGTTADGGTSPTRNASGTMFSVNPKTRAERIVYSFQGGIDGYDPSPGLTNVSNSIYGLTSEGGTAGWGTVFSITP